MFFPGRVACRNLVPWPGIKPMPPAGEKCSLNHWTSRKVPEHLLIFFLIFIYLAMPGLSCGTWDLQSLLWQVGSSSLTRDWIQAHCIGSTVLTTEPLEKSLNIFLRVQLITISMNIGNNFYYEQLHAPYSYVVKVCCYYVIMPCN